METLPVEIVANIAQHLTVKDLSSCCAVSTWWRDVFGSDVVWRPRCDVGSEEYLQTTPCRVYPKFTSPQSDNTTLSLIGRWRTAYMREAHLWRNWIHGNFVEEDIFKGDIKELLFLNNNLVVIVSGDFFILTDTSERPSVCIAKLEDSSATSLIKATVVRSDMFITLNDTNIVHVIRADLESRTLSVTFRLNGIEGPRKYVVVGTVFLGFNHDCINIWNLESGIKLKTEHMGIGCKLGMVRHNKHCKDVVVVAEGKDGVFNYLIYNLEELRFWPFSKQDSNYFRDCAIVNNYVALVSGLNTNTELTVYNYRTSKLLHAAQVMGPNKSVRGLRDSFMFVKDRNLVLLSPSDGTIRCLHPDVCTFKCFGDRLVYFPGIRLCGDKLWKFRETSIVRTLVSPSVGMKFNQTYSKFLLPLNNGPIAWKFRAVGATCITIW